jgi:hypothetical protein
MREKCICTIHIISKRFFKRQNQTNYCATIIAFTIIQICISQSNQTNKSSPSSTNQTLTTLQQLIDLNRSSREHNQRLPILKHICSSLELHRNQGADDTLQFAHLGLTDALDLSELAGGRVRETFDCVISRIGELLDVVCGYPVIDKRFEWLIGYFLFVIGLVVRVLFVSSCKVEWNRSVSKGYD